MTPRRRSTQIHVGNVAIGGDAPISVQSMTNTDTCDIAATSRQIAQLHSAGADLVRVSVPTIAAAEAFAVIKQRAPLPLIADVHFDHRIALHVLDSTDCLRINPGNIGTLAKIRSVVAKAKERNVPIRIGVNAGSLERDLLARYHEPTAAALVESALRHIAILTDLDFWSFKVSVKASDVRMAVDAYRQLAAQIEQPLHLGITEAGSLQLGSVRSAIGLGILLFDGIGDTIRVSLAADPVEEVRVGYAILKSLGLRQRGVNLIACPGCARQRFDVINVTNALEARLADVTQAIDVAVIGCVVNGPGESKQATIGVTGGCPNVLYEDGQRCGKVTNETLVDTIEQRVRAKIATQ